MFRRRRRAEGADAADTAPEDATTQDATTQDAATQTPEPPAGSDADPADRASGLKSPRPEGPWDADEPGAQAVETTGRVDLGALRVRPGAGMTMQLQVDERTGQASSVLVVAGDAAVQLIAVAAPRSEGLWPGTRAQIAADATRRGGTAEEGDGPLGRELRALVPVRTGEGATGVQPSRVVGIDGPRWMLRATFLGRATADPEAFGKLAAVVRDTVVVRGAAPMAPGDLLPLQVPEGAVRRPPPRPTPPAGEPGEPGQSPPATG